MMEKDKEFPADILLLHAPNGKELVFVDTINLDGETNLKERFIAVRDRVPTIASAQELAGRLECDPPHESLEEWDGNFHFQDIKGNSQVVNCR